MAANSMIEWTDATWNPIVGCSIVSPGCTNCYAMAMAARLDKMMPPVRHDEAVLPHHYSALTEPSKAGPVWTGRVNIAPDRIVTAPLRWKKPRKIFVNSMGDLFHESVPDEWIDRVFSVIALCPQHDFLILSKRAERMLRYVGNRQARNKVELAAEKISTSIGGPLSPKWCLAWPLPNVWLGVSAERQQEADERIPHLLQTPAAVRFVSCEPLLRPIDLTNIKPANRYECNALTGFDFDEGGVRNRLDWVIVGGESGPHARPMETAWAESIRDQCKAAGVAFFMKQMTKKRPIPQQLLIREMPHAR